MAHRRTRRTALAAAAGLLALTPATAQAAARADSSATVAATMSVFGAEAVDIGPLAPCAAGGPATGTTPGADDDSGLVGFGPGSSTCTFDPATGTASATANGRAFRLNALRLYGGPTVRVGSYSATCSTTPTGAKSSVALAGVVGVDVPDDIPPGHTITIPARSENDPPLARVTLNEQVLADPPDGSMVVHALKIRLFPEGGPASGNITLGTVTCSPA